LQVRKKQQKNNISAIAGSVVLQQGGVAGSRVMPVFVLTDSFI
jgi:hypothetical protein